MKRGRSQTADSTAAAAKAKRARVETTASAAGAGERRPATPSNSNAMLVVGSYHAVMAGLVFQRGKFFLKFSIKHHVGSVTAVCASERYVASCGTDERLFLFTNKAQQRLSPAVRERMRELGEPLAVRLADLGSLAPPSEALCLCFTPQSQHLLVGCADGRLLLYRTRDWAVQHHLSVHERELSQLALHPGSGGALCVSASPDRSVAVLDLAKGKLLTKWKYSSSCFDDRDGGEGEGEGPTTFTRTITAKESPIAVLFSPTGTHLLVLSRFSFVVYDTAAGFAATGAFRCARPTPGDELHAAAFLSDTVVILGDESGRLHTCALRGSSALATTPVAIVHPAELRAELAALPPAPSPERECRVKNPLRNVGRIKQVACVGSTVFSMDSFGIVVAYRLESAGDAVTLHYITSANCQGRTTCFSALPI